MNIINATTSAEVCSALVNTGINGAVCLNCGEELLLRQFRALRKCKHPVKGMLELMPHQFKGTNIRAVDKEDAMAMGRLFRKFVGIGKCSKPIYDAISNSMVATDGRMMLFSKVPKSMEILRAKANGFVVDPGDMYAWENVVGDTYTDEYTLSFYKIVATIRKGSETHGMMQTIGKMVRAYEHFGFTGSGEDEKKWNTLYLGFGNYSFEKNYSGRMVSSLVDALFRLGHDTVLCAERKDICGDVAEMTPMSIFGMGGSLAAKGLVMPIRRYPFETGFETGTIVFPTDEKSITSAA